MDVSLDLDLGVDSLEWLGLTLEIERRAGVELDEAAIARVATIRDLLRAVADAPRAGSQPPGRLLGRARAAPLAGAVALARATGARPDARCHEA